jgi:hypothetical protein
VREVKGLVIVFPIMMGTVQLSRRLLFLIIVIKDPRIEDRDEGGGTSLGHDSTNLFGMPGNNASFGDGGGADDLLAAASATASTAASTSLASTSAASA